MGYLWDRITGKAEKDEEREERAAKERAAIREEERRKHKANLDATERVEQAKQLEKGRQMEHEEALRRLQLKGEEQQREHDERVKEAERQHEEQQLKEKLEHEKEMERRAAKAEQEFIEGIRNDTKEERERIKEEREAFEQQFKARKDEAERRMSELLEKMTKEEHGRSTEQQAALREMEQRQAKRDAQNRQLLQYHGKEIELGGQQIAELGFAKTTMLNKAATEQQQLNARDIITKYLDAIKNSPSQLHDKLYAVIGKLGMEADHAGSADVLMMRLGPVDKCLELLKKNLESVENSDVLFVLEGKEQSNLQTATAQVRGAQKQLAELMSDIRSLLEAKKEGFAAEAKKELTRAYERLEKACNDMPRSVRRSPTVAAGIGPFDVQQLMCAPQPLAISSATEDEQRSRPAIPAAAIPTETVQSSSGTTYVAAPQHPRSRPAQDVALSAGAEAARLPSAAGGTVQGLVANLNEERSARRAAEADNTRQMRSFEKKQAKETARLQDKRLDEQRKGGQKMLELGEQSLKDQARDQDKMLDEMRDQSKKLNKQREERRAACQSLLDLQLSLCLASINNADQRALHKTLEAFTTSARALEELINYTTPQIEYMANDREQLGSAKELQKQLSSVFATLRQCRTDLENVLSRPSSIPVSQRRDLQNFLSSKSPEVSTFGRLLCKVTVETSKCMLKAETLHEYQNAGQNLIDALTATPNMALEDQVLKLAVRAEQQPQPQLLQHQPQQQPQRLL